MENPRQCVCGMWQSVIEMAFQSNVDYIKFKPIRENRSSNVLYHLIVEAFIQ